MNNFVKLNAFSLLNTWKPKCNPNNVKSSLSNCTAVYSKHADICMPTYFVQWRKHGKTTTIIEQVNPRRIL